MGPDGAIWFTEYARVKIGRISVDGSIVEYAYPHAGAHPENIVAGPDGNLWFSQGGPAAGIARITPAGHITQFVMPTAMSAPQGITAGSDGNLWFAEPGANAIARITRSGATSEYLLPGT